MLTLFRRHVSSCPHQSRRYRRCSCPIHVEGSLNGEIVRRSLDLTSWEAATLKIRAWEATGKVGGDEAKVVTVRDAVALYLKDAAARGLALGTVKLHRQLLEGNLLPWCDREGYRYLKELTLERMIDYRASWTYAPLTALKKFERLRSFFLFSERAKWLTDNPVAAMKAPKADGPPTLPFSPQEVKQIFEACANFRIRGSYGRDNPTRVTAFVAVLRYGGLRISDAAGLEQCRVTPDGKLFLHQQHKTKVPVYVPLPPFAVEALREHARRSINPRYFFWTGVGTLESAACSWKRTLYRIFGLAHVEGGHAHRFRDTFAVDLLLHDVPLENVSELLGHRSIKVTEKSYAPWVKARQDRLEQLVRRTWRYATPSPAKPISLPPNTAPTSIHQ